MGLALSCVPHVRAERPAPGPRTETVHPTDYTGVLHVSPTGSDATGDGTRERPWASITHALATPAAAKATAERRVAVLVASGTYPCTALQLRSHVDLLGGFDPSTWSRDIFANNSILDAGQKDRVLIASDHTRIDGFTIRRGRVRGPGGAILCVGTSPTISNNTIVENETLEPAGYLHGMLHQPGNDGGAIAALSGAKPVITHNLIARNATDVGGGGGVACANHSTPTIVANVFLHNVTARTDRQETRSSNGGAISCNDVPAEREGGNRVLRLSRITDNLILNNRVGGNSDAGGIYCEYDAHPEISRNLILGNTAEDDGGGIYVMKNSDPLISANVVAGNKGGGAIRISKEGRARIENNLIFANESGDVNCVGSWMVMCNNTTSDNGAYGMSFENFTQHLRPSIITGNIFHNSKRADLKAVPAGSVVFTHNLVTGGNGPPGDGNIDADPMFVDDAVSLSSARATYDAQRGQTTVTLAEGSSGASEKLLSRPVRAGDRWGVVAVVRGNELIVWGDVSGVATIEVPPTFRLRAGSPCIDKASTSDAPATDIDGETRPAGAAIDIGADEFAVQR